MIRFKFPINFETVSFKYENRIQTMNRNLLEQIYIKIVTEITNIESFLSRNLETNRLRFFNVDREISAFPSRLFRNP